MKLLVTPKALLASKSSTSTPTLPTIPPLPQTLLGINNLLGLNQNELLTPLIAAVPAASISLNTDLCSSSAFLSISQIFQLLNPHKNVAPAKNINPT